jgi:hypothetical protein
MAPPCDALAAGIVKLLRLRVLHATKIFHETPRSLSNLLLQVQQKVVPGPEAVFEAH